MRTKSATSDRDVESLLIELAPARLSDVPAAVYFIRHCSLLLDGEQTLRMPIAEIALVIRSAKKTELPPAFKLREDRRVGFLRAMVAVRFNKRMLVVVCPLLWRRHLLPALSPGLQSPGGNDRETLICMCTPGSHAGNNKSCLLSKFSAPPLRRGAFR